MPESIEGSVTDPKIQDLLVFAAKSNENSGVRLDSVDMLTGKADDLGARDPDLCTALRQQSRRTPYGSEWADSYVKKDIRVRNAVLDALLNDSNLGVRSGALRALETVRTDSSVRMALQQLSKEDPSEYIRTESKRVLASMPNIY